MARVSLWELQRRGTQCVTASLLNWTSNTHKNNGLRLCLMDASGVTMESPVLCLRLCKLERETGFEPATSSLGKRSNIVS